MDVAVAERDVGDLLAIETICASPEALRWLRGCVLESFEDHVFSSPV